MMAQVPILWNEAPTGELTLEPEGLYTCFTARCRVAEGLWHLWLIGDRGELRLGVLEPEGGHFVIRRRCSARTMAPLGTVLRGEVRSAAREETDWEPVPESERQSPWLRLQLRGQKDLWRRKEGDRTYLAVPYDKGNAFPLPPLFCLARVRPVRGTLCAVFAFGADGWPLFG